MIPSVLRLVIVASAWGVVWAGLGAILSVVFGDTASIELGVARLALTWGSVGGLCGVTFGSLIALLEPGKGVRQIPLFRAGLWGSFAGTVPPFLIASVDNSVLTNTCPLSMASALATVLVARSRYWR